MGKEERAPVFSAITTVLIWGGLWGVFEATVGYLLHLIPISIGWLVWYPAACFFMLNVYRKTRRTETILLVGLVSACIKMLNLFLPVRIDRVLNPAASIVFEALILAAVILVYKRFFAESKKPLRIEALTVLFMNTGWRILYTLYLLLIVPTWMREISVIGSTAALLTFFFVHNLLTGLVLFGGSVVIKYILKPIEALEHKLSAYLSSFPHRAAAGMKLAGAIFLLGCSIALELLMQ